MNVLYVWEECNFVNGEWGDRQVTSYWVTAHHSEIETMPLEIKEVLLDPLVTEEYMTEFGRFGLLVAKDLSSIEVFHAYYPESGMWNGYSPFVMLDGIKINSLDELQKL